MGLFGSALWGAGGQQQAVATGVSFKSLAYMAMRLAHVTKVAQIGPSPDQFADCLQAAQLMLDQATIRKPLIYTINIAAYPLVAATKIYTIGPGGTGPAWLGPNWPLYIEHAILVLASGVPVRLGIFRGSNDQWARVVVQDIAGALPRLLYCDYNYPLANIYVVPQDMGGDQLELHTWQQLPSLVTIGDLLNLPPGYSDWFVNNLAVRLASIWQEQLGAFVTDDTRTEARMSTQALMSRNLQSPTLDSDVPRHSGGGRGGGGGFNYYSGMEK